MLNKSQIISQNVARCISYIAAIFFRHKVKVLCFLVGNSAASEFYMPTFRNTLFHLNRQVGHLPAYEDGTDGVFRNVGI